MRADHSDHLFFAKLVGIALLLAVILNGAMSYLMRTGVLNQEAYRTFWASQCEASAKSNASVPADPRACAWGSYEASPGVGSIDHRKSGVYVQGASGADLLLKLVKDALGAGFVLLSAYLITRRKAALPSFRRAWAIDLLLGYFVIALLGSWAIHGTLMVVAGSRTLWFLIIALLGQCLVSKMDYLAQWIGTLLLVQVILISVEIVYGLPIYGHLFSLPQFSKASGTLNLPNSMGIFAVVSLAFFHAFSPGSRRGPFVGAAAFAGVLASGSATGLLAIAIFVFAVLIPRVAGPGKNRVLALVAGASVGVALFLGLPAITGRPYLFEASIGGRIDGLVVAFTERGAFEILFGSGLGVNTNAALNLIGRSGTELAGAAGRFPAYPSDSTITALVIQVGIVGTLLFYTLLLWAGLRDAKARVFYLIIAVCSLTLNVTELFPVNFLLGFALAHSVAMAGGGARVRS